MRHYPSRRRWNIEGLIVEHSIAHSRAQIAPNLMDEAFQKDTPPANQRLVRTIPETGKKALLVGSYTTRVHGLPIEEGKSPVEGSARMVNTTPVRVLPHMAGE